MKKIKEKNVNSKDDSIDILLAHISELVKYSYELEEKRESSLMEQSSRMLEVFSFITAGLGVLLPVVLEYMPRLSKSFVFCGAGVIAIFLISSLVLATLAQWRYKYKAMPLPREIYSHIYNNYNGFTNKINQTKHMVDLLDEIQSKKKELNDRRARLVTLSMICFYIAIGLFIFASTIAIGMLIE